MPETTLPAYDLREMQRQTLQADEIASRLLRATESLSCERHLRGKLRRGASEFAQSLAPESAPLQEAWERSPAVIAMEGAGKPAMGEHWWALVRAASATRMIRPTWPIAARSSSVHILRLLPKDDPLVVARGRLEESMSILGNVSSYAKAAPNTVLKIMLVNGYDRPEQICEDDLVVGSRGESGSKLVSALDYADALLCAIGVFDRSPIRGYSRARRAPIQPSVEDLVAKRQIPERFQSLTIDYLNESRVRLDYAYSTIKQRVHQIAAFWIWIDEQHPDVLSAADVTPAHGREFMQAQIELSRTSRKGIDADSGIDDRITVHAMVGGIRAMFHDLATWAIEPDSPFAGRVPTVPPLKNRDLLRFGLRGIRAKQQAKMQRHVLDLERELPGIRAYALATWSEAREVYEQDPENHAAMRREGRTFWRWALLELFIQTGLRIEEAIELTALDVLKRQLPDGRLYYLLHIKPSKNGRARLIPIGDELGRLLAEIVRHVKAFYCSRQVPAVDAWDFHENQMRPRAPYLLQGNGHPRAMAQTTVRELLKEVSLEAGAQRPDGSPLYFRPHDGRRVFASEHLNNNTPVHVIAALLGHAGLETVMVYAKLYPKTLVAEYRKAVRGSFITASGGEQLKNPTPEEWEEFERSCSLRDMGTHVCALPTGDHCERGLVCLGCSHAQPKRSAEPVFARMLTSHRRELTKARERGEPAGQVAARELEVDRIELALRRTRSLPTDVATAIEATV